MATQNITVSNAHSVVVDEAKLASKQVAVRVYDVKNNQLLNLVINTDRTSSPVAMKNHPAPPPPPPPPLTPTVQINGSSAPVTVAAGAAITATVADGPGNPGSWLGVYAVGSLSGPRDPGSWKWLSTDGTGSIPPSGVTSGTVHLVVPVAAGQYEVRLFDSSAFKSVVKSAAITVAAPARTLVLTLSPVTVSVPDTAPAGTALATATVKYSDGTLPAAVTLTSSDPAFIAIKGMQLVSARALTAADDGAHPMTVTASDGLGVIATARLFGGPAESGAETG